MPSPLSVNLRERVVAAVAGGASFHRAAVRFWVSVSSASRWSERFAQQGHVAPKPTQSDDSLPAIEAHTDLILSLDEAQAELFLHELCAALAEQGVTTSTSRLSRFFARHRITRKRVAARGRAKAAGREGCPVGLVRELDV